MTGDDTGAMLIGQVDISLAGVNVTMPDLLDPLEHEPVVTGAYVPFGEPTGKGQIVKGRIRDDLRKFLTKGELIGKEGKHLISIPVRGIELPHFRYGDNSQGVGAGDGKEGKQVIDVFAWHC